jgi:hypothetical protein
MASQESAKSKQHDEKDDDKKVANKEKDNQSQREATAKADSKEEKSAKGGKNGGNHESGDWSQQIDELINALNGDLGELQSEQAIALIDEWHGLLHQSKDDGAEVLAGHLKQLRQLVKGNKASGHDIGEALAELGSETTHIVGDLEKGQKQSVQKLGKQLSRVGNALGKAEDQENIEQIDSLTELVEEDLASVEPQEGIEQIDLWYGLLHKADNDQYKQVAEGLKHLKQVLNRKSADPAEIAEILTQLGEQTTAIAAEAPRGMKGHIQRLGKSLGKSAKDLESEVAESEEAEAKSQ